MSPIKRNIPFIQIPLPEWFEPVVRTVWDKMKRDSTGHDFFHAVRVMELAVEISDELAADREIAMTAGLLHDYYREEEKESGLLHYGLEAMEGLRREFGPLIIPNLGEERFERMIEAISRHEEYPFAFKASNAPAELSIEAQILQDADRLDAIGAVGIARTFMFGGAHGLPLAEEADRTEGPGTFDPGQRPQGSVYRHFYEKLLFLADGMHTAPGRRIASERHTFLISFLKQLEKELRLGTPTITH